MSEWRETTLGEVLQPKGYIRGPFGSALRRNELSNNGVPVYEQQHAIYGIRTFRFFISEKKFKEMRRFTVQTDDLIISCSGTIGKVSRIQKNDGKGIISQALLLLRVDKEKIRPLYLQYILSSKEGYNSIVSRSSGSVQVNIARREIIESIPLTLPTLPEQDNILAVLSSLDDKINLLTQQNETLEALAQTYFRQWIIEKADDTWKESTVGEQYDILLGGTPSRTESSYWDNGTIGWINSGKVNEFRILTPSEMITESGLRNSATKLLPTGTTVIAITGATLGQISRVERPFAANQSVIGIVPKSNLSNEFCYYWIKINMDELINRQTGGAQQHINSDDVKSFRILFPPTDVIERLTSIIEPLSEKISQNSFLIETLQKLRDTLLPKLISGEVRVRQ
jgi:type I restriction enzyme S subunit